MDKETIDINGAKKESLIYLGASLVALMLPFYKVSFFGFTETAMGINLLFMGVNFMYLVVLAGALAIEIVPLVRDNDIVKQYSKIIEIAVPVVLALITFLMTRSASSEAMGMGSVSLFAYALIVLHVVYALYKSGNLETIINNIKNK